jgi:hypothetical protein
LGLHTSCELREAGVLRERDRRRPAGEILDARRLQPFELVGGEHAQAQRQPLGVVLPGLGGRHDQLVEDEDEELEGDGRRLPGDQPHSAPCRRVPGERRLDLVGAVGKSLEREAPLGIGHGRALDRTLERDRCVGERRAPGVAHGARDAARGLGQGRDGG